MPLTAKVVPGETFPDNETVTRAKLRNSANPSVTIENSLSNVEVAANAGVQLGKLEGVAEGALLVGSAVNNAANASLKAIAAVTMPSGDSVYVGGGVTATTGIVPSNLSVKHDTLAKSQYVNIIRGAKELGKCMVSGVVNNDYTTKATCEAASPTAGVWTAEAVAADDWVLLANKSNDQDSEATGDVNHQLRRVPIADLLKSTFSTQVALTSVTPTASDFIDEDTTKTIDLDANPVQSIACKTPSAGVNTEYTLSIAFDNLPATSGFAKNVMLVIFNLTSTTAVKLDFVAPANGKVRFIGSTPPAKLAAGKAGVLAITGWPNNNLLLGYSAEL
jgi:hypothetical protein